MKADDGKIQLRGRVTITEVAAALGLTKGTVSRALNDYADIAEQTRIRVRRQAERMGYRPLAQAQAIRTGRSRGIGLVLQADASAALRPFLSDFLEGLSRAASAESWTLTVATSDNAELLHTLERLVEERKADGFILPRTFRDDPRAALLRKLGVPFVLYGRTRDEEGCAWYDIRGEDAMREAVARLVAHGHRRIAFVNAEKTYNFAHLRDEGFRAGLSENGLAVDESLVVEGAMTTEAGDEATERLLHLPDPPTAIVFSLDLAALGAYEAARRLGLQIGRDLSVISYDGIPEGRWAHPALTTFRVDSRRAGARLAHLLICRIRGAALEDLRETARAELLTGGSDGPPILTSAEIARRVARTGRD